MMNNKINIRQVLFDDLTMEEALVRCSSYFNKSEASSPCIIHTPNAEIVQNCVSDPAFCAVINSADLIVPDGIGVILAGRMLKTPFRGGRLPGVELCEKLLALCAEAGKSVYFLGGKKGVPDEAAQRMMKKYPGLTVVGRRDGYFDANGEENNTLIEDINRSGADFLIVCLGSPKQEQWMQDNKNKLTVSLMGGFGGSIDVFAGTAKRAPAFFCNHGLEWLYRLIKQPKRLGRMMKIPLFLIQTMMERNKNQRS